MARRAAVKRATRDDLDRALVAKAGPWIVTTLLAVWLKRRGVTIECSKTTDWATCEALERILNRIVRAERARGK